MHFSCLPETQNISVLLSLTTKPQSFEKQNGLDRLREICVTCDGMTADEGVWFETICPLRRVVIAGQFDPSA